MELTYFYKFIPLLITGLGSLMVGICLEKFRNKLTFLKYKIFFQPLATTSQNDYWGSITVLHNDDIVNHLNFVTVEIQNDSNCDMENLNVDICVDNQSQILGVRGFYNESANAILLEQGYFSYFENVIQRNMDENIAASSDPNYKKSPQLTNEIRFVLSNKKFHLPVFNRHSSVTIHLLVENFEGLNPIVTVSTLHKSTKLILEANKESENKKTTIWAFFVGLFVFIIGFFFLLRYYTDATTPLILSAILGLTYSLIGWGLYRLGRYIKRLLS